MSPQPWDAYDPSEDAMLFDSSHFNLKFDASVQPLYVDSYESTDSPNSNDYASDIKLFDF